MSKDGSESSIPFPSRLVTDEDLKAVYSVIQINEASKVSAKRRSGYLGGLDTQQYGRGKRAREVSQYFTFMLQNIVCFLYMDVNGPGPSVEWPKPKLEISPIFLA